MEIKIKATELIAALITLFLLAYTVSSASTILQTCDTSYKHGYNGWSYIMGYQFTPQLDGAVTKLCAYVSGTKTVKIWDSSYSELASASVTASGNWACTSISPLNVKKSNNYYVGVCLAGGYGYYDYLSTPLTCKNISVDYSFYYLTSGCSLVSGATPNSNAMYGLADIEFDPGGGAGACGQNPKIVSVNLNYTGTPIAGELRLNPNNWNEADWHCFWWDSVFLKSQKTKPTNPFQINITTANVLTPGYHNLKMSTEAT